MRPITLVYAYYMNPRMLQHALGYLDFTGARVIVVDDGSPPPKDACTAAMADNRVGFSLYRMKEDHAWNQDACRNLGVAMAETEWVMLLDMDHLPSLQLLQRAQEGALDDKTAYTFTRMTVTGADRRLEPYKPHPNSWLMHRDLFEKVDGYDERWRGIYGTDGMFASKIRAAAKDVVQLPFPIYRYPREVIPDASTTTLTRKSPENEIARRVRRDEIAAGKWGDKTRGLTPWERVF